MAVKRRGGNQPDDDGGATGKAILIYIFDFSETLLYAEQCPIPKWVLNSVHVRSRCGQKPKNLMDVQSKPGAELSPAMFDPKITSEKTKF